MTSKWHEILTEQYLIAKKYPGGVENILPCMPDEEDRQFIRDLQEIDLRAEKKK